MFLLEEGLSISDIESLKSDYDAREVQQLIEELGEKKKQENKNKELRRLYDLLNFNDAVYYGIAPLLVAKGKGYTQYKRWRNRIITAIHKLKGRKITTVWDKKDRMRKTGRRSYKIA